MEQHHVDASPSTRGIASGAPAMAGAGSGFGADAGRRGLCRHPFRHEYRYRRHDLVENQVAPDRGCDGQGLPGGQQGHRRGHRRQDARGSRRCRHPALGGLDRGQSQFRARCPSRWRRFLRSQRAAVRLAGRGQAGDCKAYRGAATAWQPGSRSHIARHWQGPVDRGIGRSRRSGRPGHRPARTATDQASPCDFATTRRQASLLLMATTVHRQQGPAFAADTQGSARRAGLRFQRHPAGLARRGGNSSQGGGAWH